MLIKHLKHGNVSMIRSDIFSGFVTYSGDHSSPEALFAVFPNEKSCWGKGKGGYLARRQYFRPLIKMNVSSSPHREVHQSPPRDRPRVSLTLSMRARSAILLQTDASPWQQTGAMERMFAHLMVAMSTGTSDWSPDLNDFSFKTAVV